MKKLYQTLKTLFETLPLAKPKLVMLKCPRFLMKCATKKSPAPSENYTCYMDRYQLEQMSLLQQIGINMEFTQDGLR